MIKIAPINRDNSLELCMSSMLQVIIYFNSKYNFAELQLKDIQMNQFTKMNHH